MREKTRIRLTIEEMFNLLVFLKYFHICYNLQERLFRALVYPVKAGGKIRIRISDMNMYGIVIRFRNNETLQEIYPDLYTKFNAAYERMIIR